MLPRLRTLSLLPAEAAKETPCGRTYPRCLKAAEADDERDVVDGREKLETSDEVVENERPNSEHVERGGVGDIDGEGDGSLV